MPKIFEIDKFMSDFAPENLSESWDNDGIMLCGNENSDVKKVIVCLEINEKIVNDAKKEGADLVITHHPYIFNPLKRICGNDYAILSELIKNNISVISYHTRLDATIGGVNDVLAKKIGLCNVKEFVSENSPLGRVGKLEKEMNCKEFAQHLKNTLKVPYMRCTFNDETQKISTVAVVGGGGKDFVLKASEIADAYVSSDFSHTTFINAKTNGIAIFDAGHYYTENPVTARICEILKGKFPGLDVVISDSLCPFEVL